MNENEDENLLAFDEDINICSIKSTPLLIGSSWFQWRPRTHRPTWRSCKRSYLALTLRAMGQVGIEKCPDVPLIDSLFSGCGGDPWTSGCGGAKGR